MNRNIVKYLIVLVLCLALTVSAASALDDLFFSKAKQALINQYTGGTPGGGTPGGGIPGKPLPGYMPSSYVYVGRLPFIMRVGDTHDVVVHGPLKAGQTFAIEIQNGKFTAPQGAFVFNFTGVELPANASQVDVTVSAQPVSWLKIESLEEGIIKSLESSSPDQHGRIILAATGFSEDKTQVHDYMATHGISTVPQVTINHRIEGVLTEDVTDAVLPFHIGESQRGSFTMVVLIDGREKLRETIFIL